MAHPQAPGGCRSTLAAAPVHRTDAWPPLTLRTSPTPGEIVPHLSPSPFGSLPCGVERDALSTLSHQRMEQRHGKGSRANPFRRARVS